MRPTITIAPEPPKPLSMQEERALLRQALARRDSPELRIKLAQLHNLLDDFGETIALLGNNGPPESFAAAHMLTAAYLKRRQQGDLEAAIAAARVAEGLAQSDTARADALVYRARALLAHGEGAEAQDALVAALALNPSNYSALRSLCGLSIDSNAPSKVLEICDAIAARGAANVQMLGMQTVALAQLGRPDEARALAGFDRFLCETRPAAPPGWDDLPAFHAALTHELMGHPALRNGRSGTASIATQRIDEPARGDATPAISALQRLICDNVSAQIDQIGQADHPWLRQRPAAALLRMWCVMTRSDGFERWHMHPAGWASGGYYVAVPDSVAGGTARAGCLAFGVPDRFVGKPAAAAVGTRLLRPRAGLLSLFPSHAYHRTYPHEADGVRICIAFDLVPQ